MSLMTAVNALCLKVESQKGAKDLKSNFSNVMKTHYNNVLRF